MSGLDAILTVARRDALATLTRVLGDLDLAQDAVQDATVRALTHFREAGVPDNPSAWLVRAGRNAAIDRLRRRRVARDASEPLQTLAATSVAPDEEGGLIYGDDLLRLIFTCCHPQLSRAEQVALTLRTVAGLSPDEISRALLLQPRTLEQRLTRAKRRIREGAIEYAVPREHEWPERLDGVLAVLYLVFNEGYKSHSGPAALRPDLCRLAIRLGALLCRLVRGEPEVTGLLALMLLTHARAPARQDAGGALIPLEQQDRTCWDAALIAEGRALLDKASLARRTGPYQLQAAIAAVHAAAREANATDWREIAALYAALQAVAPSPVVRLGRAVAVARSRGPAEGLALHAELADDPAMERYAHYHVVGAGLMEELGQAASAAASYRRALSLGLTEAERAHVLSRLAQLEKS